MSIAFVYISKTEPRILILFSNVADLIVFWLMQNNTNLLGLILDIIKGSVGK